MKDELVKFRDNDFLFATCRRSPKRFRLSSANSPPPNILRKAIEPFFETKNILPQQSIFITFKTMLPYYLLHLPHLHQS